MRKSQIKPFFFFSSYEQFNFALITCLTSSIAKLNFLLTPIHINFQFFEFHIFSCFVLYIRRRKREKKCVGRNRRGKKEMGRLFLCISIPKRSIDLLAVESLVFEPFHANKSRGRRQTFLRGYLIPRLAIDRWFAPIRDKKRIVMIVGAWLDDT